MRPRRPHFVLLGYLLWPLQVLFARFEVPDPPPEIRDGSWIVVANHRSMYDVMIGIVLFRKWRWPITMLINARYMENPVYRWLRDMSGAIGIDQEKPLQALREAKASLASGRPVLVMPEGRLAPTGTPKTDLLPLEPGAAMLATKNETGVIIGALWGSDDVWPAERKRPPLRLPWNRPTIRVRYELLPADHGLGRAELNERIDQSLRRQLTEMAAVYG